MQQVDDPPYLSVGTEVSAKYKGAFCEAKVRKVDRNIKCKVAYKQGLGSGTVSDDQIKGDLLRVGATVEVKHPDRKDFVEAVITKIQDSSQYTVVFDDGDITTLRRSALCLKSGRHFNESETLDQLPLTHPEHFGNPVIGGRRGRRNLDLFKKTVNRSRHMPEDSSDDDEESVSNTKQRIAEKEEHIGKVVCVENTETKKKSSKENWFPALVVAPTAQAAVRIRVKDEYLVRSFKDGRYYTVPKKEATEFSREKNTKQNSDAVLAALEYLSNDSLPTHWDRDVLFAVGSRSSDSDGDEEDSDTSDDEPREEKDHFVAQLYKYMDDRGTPLNKGPSIVNKDVDLYRLFRAVQKLGGYNKVTSQSQWKQIATRLGYTPTTTSIQNLVKQAYKKFLLPFEEFDRKLGCTMVAHPRANRIKGRSLVRANSVASPKPDKDIKSSAAMVNADESENTSESGAENLQLKRKLSTSSGKVRALVEKYEEKIKEEIKDAAEEAAKEALKECPAGVKAIIKDSPVSSKDLKKIRSGELKEAKEIKAEIDIETIVPSRIGKVVLLKEESPTSSAGMGGHVQGIAASQIVTSPSCSLPMGSGNGGGGGSNRKEKQPKRPQTALEERKMKKRKADTDSEKTDKVEVNDFPIEIGDKLKVYYHEKKVTYEAKVIEISTQQENSLYLVHYTGWNTRYDEWVPKERIAENLTNNKTNKRAKTGGAVNCVGKTGDTKSSGLDKFIGTTSSLGVGAGTVHTAHPSKILFKRGRGSSRGESQPPRSTTPSSVASNSSRTKSPATPAQRRTTRGQPSSIRRTSNNTDISSIQTDTDTDSDEPVKKPPSRKIPLPRLSQPSTSTSTASGTKTNSNPSSEEESLGHHNISTKGREYDLIQIRSELKGFKELKSPSPDLFSESNEKKFEFPSSTASNTESGDSISQDITKVVTSDSKTSSDTSSESEDSYGDDDSQFSDKATTLENLSEKLQEKFKAGKLDTDVFKKVTPLGVVTVIATPTPPPPPPLPSVHSELVDKVATLKASGIEQIIKNSLAEKPKAPAEKMTMKALCERSPLKQMEKEKQREKDATGSIVEKVPTKQTALSQAPQASTGSKLKSPKTDRVARTIPPIAVMDKVMTKILPDSGPSDPDSDEPASPVQPSVCELPLADVTPPTKAVDVPDKKTANTTISSTLSLSVSASTAGDIYEFKEPEPFEFETVNKKLSPDIDKKPKKKPFTESMDPKVAALPMTTSSLSATKKNKKASPAKEEKPISQPIPNEKTETPPLDAIRPAEEFAVLAPQKSESIFDSLRKSPSFNLTLQGNSHQNHLDDLQVLSMPSSSSSASVLVKEEFNEPIATTSSSSCSKPTFISSFVEATPEETMKIFDPKSSLLNASDDDDDGDDEKAELETAKKILLAEEMYEPPKIDKPSSIADKVLKALNQQQQQLQLAKFDDTAKPIEAERLVDPPVVLKVTEVKLERAPSPPIISEPPKIELPAIIKRDIETPPKKPVLSSPEHKVDILESIAPKNNDLSETIQKLESVIQQTVDMGNISDESSDSTDSEQRLIIEDESLSSETQNEFGRTITSPNNMATTAINTIANTVTTTTINSSTTTTTITTTTTTTNLTKASSLDTETGAYSLKVEFKPVVSKIEYESHHSEYNVAVSAASITPLISPPTQPLSQLFGSKYSFGEPPKIVDKPTTSASFSIIEPLAARPIKLPASPPGALLVLPPSVTTEFSFKYSSTSLFDTTAQHDAESNIPISTIKREDPFLVSTQVPTVTIATNTTTNTATETAATKESLSLLLCEETIPGSPTPLCPREIGGDLNINLADSIIAGPKKGYEIMFASPHPTTSDIKSVPMDIETTSVTSSTCQPNSVDLVAGEVKQKIEPLSPQSSARDSLSHDDSSEDIRKHAQEGDIMLRKRRRSKKPSECEGSITSKRRKGTSRRNTTTGSDSEDNSEYASQQRPSKPCQYNFLVQLDPALNSHQRISILNKKIQELRKTYNNIKAELASIDRRRKKLRRREREQKKHQSKLQHCNTMLMK